MESWLYSAVERNKVEEVEEILRNHPNININWGCDSRTKLTALHTACDLGRDKIVPLLLAHSTININANSGVGETPFYKACIHGRVSCVRQMLKDARLIINKPNKVGSTPLWVAAKNGHLQVVKLLIISDREVDLGQPGNKYTDVIGIAKGTGKTEVVLLLEGFRDHPELTRHQLKLEFGMYLEIASDIFALVIFLCDGLLQIKDEDAATSKELRFLKIARALPMELQMILCHRAAGSVEMNISSRDAELGFKRLTQCLLI